MQKITVAEYVEAVAGLIPLALQYTHGGRAAAQVLLSAFNGGEFQLDITDLCNLDRKNYALAISVIRGRYETGSEPHNVVKDGSSIFSELWDRWKSLQVSERGKTLCRNCHGSGVAYIDEEKPSLAESARGWADIGPEKTEGGR